MADILPFPGSLSYGDGKVEFTLRVRHGSGRRSVRFGGTIAEFREWVANAEKSLANMD